MRKKMTGKMLIKLWGLPVKQARYREDGTWYQPLTNFPASLCDADGYVVFETKEQYESCPQLDRRQDIHVTGGICLITGYTHANGQEMKDPAPRGGVT